MPRLQRYRVSMDSEDLVSKYGGDGTYSSFVIQCNCTEEARIFHPCGMPLLEPTTELNGWVPHSETSKLTVELIGVVLRDTTRKVVSYEKRQNVIVIE